MQSTPRMFQLLVLLSLEEALNPAWVDWVCGKLLMDVIHLQMLQAQVGWLNAWPI